MTLLLLGAVLAASLPLLAGVVVGAFVPWTGGLRPGVGLAHLLHLLWIYPVLFLVATVSEAVGKYFRQGGERTRVGDAAGFVVLWLAVALMLNVFFERPEGAAVAAAVAVALYWPFVHYLERKSAADDEG